MAKFSESLRNKLLDTDSVKTLMTGFAVTFFNGAIPTLPSDAVTGDTLITFTVDNDGVTGGTWGSATLGNLLRTVSENLQGTCLVGSSPTFYRIHIVGESAASANTTYYRIQGTCGIARADCILDSTFFPMVLGTVYPLGNVVISSYTGD